MKCPICRSDKDMELGPYSSKSLSCSNPACIYARTKAKSAQVVKANAD